MSVADVVVVVVDNERLGCGVVGAGDGAGDGAGVGRGNTLVDVVIAVGATVHDLMSQEQPKTWRMQSCRTLSVVWPCSQITSNVSHKTIRI